MIPCLGGLPLIALWLSGSLPGQGNRFRYLDAEQARGFPLGTIGPALELIKCLRPVWRTENVPRGVCVLTPKPVNMSLYMAKGVLQMCSS